MRLRSPARFASWTLVCAAATLVATPALAQLAPRILSSGFNFPMHVAAPPGDTQRLFVVERSGTIRIFNRATNTILASPFLNITPRVNTAGEGGLYTIVFHPNYATNGFFFIFYTTDIDPGTSFNLGSRVSRFQVSANPSIADAASETVFLEVDKPSEFHNGGMLAFRPGDANHYLYISLGDGGAGCDPGQRAQNLNDKLGKLLRISVDAGPGASVSAPFAPATNPFVGVAGDDTIWAYGFRNPYRFSFDRATGDLFLGDVGQTRREEIDFESAASTGGRNYGWDAMEGATPTVGCFPPVQVKPGMVAPLIDYAHDAQPAAVTGGYVYRGLAYPAIAGRYFYADFELGQIWSFVLAGGIVTDFQDHTSVLGLGLDGITSFGEGGDGELFYVNYHGQLIRIVSPPPDEDQDLLSNESEDDGGVFVGESQTGTDPTDPDSDDDGVMDGIEVALGTDPNNPIDFPNLPATWIWALGAGALALLAGGSLYALRLMQSNPNR